MGFEDRILGGIDRDRERKAELHPRMQQAYEKAKLVLEDPDYAIQESDFKSVYGEQAIASDVAYVERMESRFESERTSKERNAKKIADVLEAIVLTQSEMSEWLGNATTLKSSRYDDIKNKVDMIAEWYAPREGSRILGLGVDVTSGIGSVVDKIRGIKSEVDSGKLGTIRYFKDERGDFMGTRNNVPRTVIGISQPVVQELAGLWLEGEKKLLGQHPIQRVIVDQIEVQLRSGLNYATKIGKQDAVHAYRSALAALEPVIEAKKQISAGALAHDPVAEEIALQTAHLLRA